MALRRIKIENKIYDVVDSFDMYMHPNLYANQNTALLCQDGNVYPIRSSADDNTGIYKKNSLIYEIKINDHDDINKYSTDNIIDFTSVQDIHDIIEKSNTLRDLEKEVLTNPDNIFLPNIGPNDTAEMKALKEAVILKNIDIDKYESRFGPSYCNDKRLFKKDKISMDKFKNMCNNLDIKATIILEDANPDVANPMNTVIKVDLTGGATEDE